MGTQLELSLFECEAVGTSKSDLWRDETWLRDQYVEQRKNFREIGRACGTTGQVVMHWLGKYGVPLRPAEQWRRNTFNLDALRSWSSPGISYFLGYAMADGAVIDCPENYWLQIASTDKDILCKLAEVVEFTGTITTKVHRNNPTWKDCHSLKLCHWELPAVLKQYNLIPSKSLVAEMPEVPSDLLNHYVRGVFDGDGCACLYHLPSGVVQPRFSFASGSRKFLAQMASDVEGACGARGRLSPMNNSFSLTYNKPADAILLMRFMYQNANGLYMNRKRDNFEQYLLNIVQRIRAERCMPRMTQETRNLAFQLISEWPTIDNPTQEAA